MQTADNAKKMDKSSANTKKKHNACEH